MESKLLAAVPGIRHVFGTKDGVSVPDGVVTARQVHGTGILKVMQASSPSWGEGLGEGEADILITDRPGIPIAVRTADCLPILIVEPVRGIVAAVHAGWRGTLSKVVQKAVGELIRLGAKADRMTVALGPCIGGGCYEVSSDVAAPFEERFTDAAGYLKKRASSKWLLDLAAANRHQLIEAGVPEGQIDQIDLCTHCRPDLFHSFRRDNESAGRMVNFVEILPSYRR